MLVLAGARGTMTSHIANHCSCWHSWRWRENKYPEKNWSVNLVLFMLTPVSKLCSHVLPKAHFETIFRFPPPLCRPIANHFRTSYILCCLYADWACCAFFPLNFFSGSGFSGSCDRRMALTRWTAASRRSPRYPLFAARPATAL